MADVLEAPKLTPLLSACALRIASRRQSRKRSDTPLSELYPAYLYRIASTGATLTLDNSISLLFGICQVTRECQVYSLFPVLDVTPCGGDFLGLGLGLLQPPSTFTCTLTLPPLFQIDPITTPAVSSKLAAKAIAAFTAVVLFHERGIMDDDLNPKKEDVELLSYPGYMPEIEDVELMARYSLPSSPSDMGLEPVLGGEGVAVLVHVYSFVAAPTVGLLTRTALGEDWSGWKDKLTSLAGEGLQVARTQLVSLARFHTYLLKLSLEGRDVFLDESPHSLAAHPDIPADRDMGYLLVPLQADGSGLDWTLINASASAPEPSLLANSIMWPLPDGDPAEWMILSHRGRDRVLPRLWRVVEVGGKLLGQVRKKGRGKRVWVRFPGPREGENRSANAEAGSRGAPGDVGSASAPGQAQAEQPQESQEKEDRAPKRHKTQKDEGPQLMQGDYEREVLDACDHDQPLLLVELVASNSTTHAFRQDHPKGPPSSKTPDEDEDGDAKEEEAAEEMQVPVRRLLVPELCSQLRISRSLYLGCQKALPVLWELERRFKVQELIRRVGVPVCPETLATALCKPDYERLEAFGDSYLKLVTAQFVLTIEPFIEREGLLHLYQENLLCNKRLLYCALQKDMHRALVLRQRVHNEPFKHWAPSLLSLPGGDPAVGGKVIADVGEAVLGAYLLHGGPTAADQFLLWLGLPVGCKAECFVGLRQAQQPGPGGLAWPLPLKDCKCW